MTLSNNLQSTIDLTAQNLQTEAATAQQRFIAFEGLIRELRYLQEKDPIINRQQVAVVAQRPDVDDPTLAASYPTPCTALYLDAITNPTHFNVNHCLTVTAMQITKQSGLPELQDVHLIPAIIRMFPTVRTDVAGDTESLVELAATIGRSRINVQNLPLWWPTLLKDATDMALNRVINNADEAVELNNSPIFHDDDLGRFMPTTRKAKDLNRALFLRALTENLSLPIDIDPTLDKHFESVVDTHATAWMTHSIRRFPQQLVPDDCNYVAATSANISPHERLALHQAAVSITERYDNPLAAQEPVPHAIRTILHESDPARSQIPDNLDQSADRIGNLAAMLASIRSRPLHHITIALIGRIIRTASICSNIHMPTVSTNQADAALVTHALEDIAILAPALPTVLVNPIHRDILITTNADKISAVETLTSSPNPQR